MNIEELELMEYGDRFDIWKVIKTLSVEIISLKQEIERLKNRPIFYEASTRLTEEDLK